MLSIYLNSCLSLYISLYRWRVWTNEKSHWVTVSPQRCHSVAQFMYDTTEQQCDEEVAELASGEIDAGNLKDKTIKEKKTTHFLKGSKANKWLVSSLWNKNLTPWRWGEGQTYSYTIRCLHTTTCRVCWAPIRGLLVVIWARVCWRVLTSRTTEPNMANIPNRRPLLNLEEEEGTWAKRVAEISTSTWKHKWFQEVVWDESELRTRGRVLLGWCERSVQTVGWIWWSAISHGRGTASALGSPATTRSWFCVSATTAKEQRWVHFSAAAAAAVIVIIIHYYYKYYNFKTCSDHRINANQK